MIDREKVVTVLRRRFPFAHVEDVAAAANAIMGLGDEWEDVTALEPDLLAHLRHACSDACFLACQAEDAEFRVYRRNV